MYIEYRYITLRDVKEAMEKSKNKKAPGLNGKRNIKIRKIKHPKGDRNFFGKIINAGIINAGMGNIYYNTNI